MWDRLFAPLMAAAAGSLTTSLFFHPHFSLPIAHYTQMRLVDIASGAIVAAIGPLPPGWSPSGAFRVCMSCCIA